MPFVERINLYLFISVLNIGKTPTRRRKSLQFAAVLKGKILTVQVQFVSTIQLTAYPIVVTPYQQLPGLIPHIGPTLGFLPLDLFAFENAKVNITRGEVSILRLVHLKRQLISFGPIEVESSTKSNRRILTNMVGWQLMHLIKPNVPMQRQVPR